MPRAVCALGITQITAWGTSNYCLGVLAKPIAADTGWELSVVYFGFTVALLAMAVVSTRVGRAIDRHGARAVMTWGTVLVSAGLFALSFVRSEAAYLAVWTFLGVAMRLCLYDAAFAGLVQVVPSRGRLAISYLTLFGAFASTVFWPVGHYFNELMGWRQTLVAFAAINLAVCLPLNWYGLAHREAPGSAAAGTTAHVARDGRPLEGAARRRAVALFALIVSLYSFVFGVVAVQLVPLLEAAGLATAAAVWVASMKGFAQFGGRLVEIVFGRNLHAMTVARIAIGALPFSYLLLYFSAGNFYAILGFTLLMGASQGVVTIVRGALPLALFGTQGYGTVLGVIAAPAAIVGAIAPTAFSLAAEAWGWKPAELLLVALAGASWIGIELMSRWVERQRRMAPKEETAT
ncbi:MAG TPA: MFS transporter [Burkholderiales bacterium]|nr:MFS transporter [Burkholderiales bacterium]